MKEILLKALACPKCHGELQYDTEQNSLICPKDKLVYLIKDNIPVLLENEAKTLNSSISVHE
ncbi:MULTISPECIES: Trm112 family protein [unclassified Gilliamella]|uniref:Trm112 family protein n=1 Tax=unclassified Gilliamella TaxID=2685620 RepID=UPI00226A6CD3|nr:MULTISPECIES: Trm112 family protein [unclassified Gilliamella]MCX8579013.1 Trm112 family protein [Gilliamella sp. B2717]MCX8588251.1 Trm112 family protein [Gilliamella sp. B3801]MCX8593266.1 Trm112 family protein [Gilliamella sp. B3804]